jgi:SAM-dependent methyltransferase
MLRTAAERICGFNTCQLLQTIGKGEKMMFCQLNRIAEKPDLHAVYTAEALWNNPYISRKMLEYHLDSASDLASRNFGFIEASVAFMKERFKIGGGKAVIDFGCGPGLYTTRFARLGSKVRGLDFSVNSIDYARKEAATLGLDIEYLHQNYLDYQASEIFDLVTMIFCDYCVLSDSQRKLLLRILKDSMKEDGHIFMDVCTGRMYQKIEEGISFQCFKDGGFWSPRHHYEFKSTFKYDVSRVSLDKYTIVEEKKTFEIYNWLKHFTLAELEKEFKESGLEIAEVYSDVRGTPYSTASEVMAVVGKSIKC